MNGATLESTPSLRLTKFEPEPPVAGSRRRIWLRLSRETKGRLATFVWPRFDSSVNCYLPDFSFGLKEMRISELVQDRACYAVGRGLGSVMPLQRSDSLRYTRM